MKLFHRLHVKLSTLGAAAVLCAGIFGAKTALANPYASCITITNGLVQFYLNEGGGVVTITYEDGSTNALYNGLTNFASGPYSFPITNNSIAHTSYVITCHKNGTGTPFAITTSTPYNLYSNVRGVDVNKNPQNGSTFGRIYVGSAGVANSGTSSLRAHGIYMLSPDLSTNLAPGGGTNPVAGGVWAAAFAAGSSSAPYHIFVGSDNNVYVADFATADATIYEFDAKFSAYTNVVIGPIGESQGFAAGTHGDPTGVAITGSLATSNLVVYTWDPDLPTTYTNALYMLDMFGNPIYHLGSEGQTTPGQFNNICQYVIGAGLSGVTNVFGGSTLWTNAPNKMVSTGLPNLQDITVGDVAEETNGYTVGMYARSNFSDGTVQVYDTNFNLIYTSLQPNGTDPFNIGSATAYYPYEGIRISPDNQFLMAGTINNYFEICFLTNGIPDVSSMNRIATTSLAENGRGCGWDAADNMIQCSSGTALVEYYSLGYTSTCVTSNDVTGTNGSFALFLPPVSASLTITQPTASQNHISSGGTPTSAGFNISLNTATLTNAITVNFSFVGNGTNGVNFVLNAGTNADGVIIKTNSGNSVTFPVGTYPEGGNWTVAVTVTPTASPLSGPTFVENVIVAGGTTYIPAEPVSGFITIYNTGPQLLVLSADPSGTAMSRAVPADAADFLLTRYGDQSVASYTVTNFIYGGTAVFPVDYTAGAQTAVQRMLPVDGTPGIAIPTGASTITNLVGNPVAHTNLNAVAANVTIVLSLTNAVTGTNLTSLEGQAYTVATNNVVLTELDNTYGGETVIWSDPMTNAADSSNWTVTFATTALATNTALPVVVPNYTNGESTIISGGTNDFTVQFGNLVSNDGVPPSPLMAANGWTTALKASVENSTAAPAGVNILPQGVSFKGNYALRFSMYLRLYDRAYNNPYYSGTVDRQYAIFGMNNKGTNCDYRPTAPVFTGSGGTNWDGQWFAIDAGIDAITPADYDAFSSPVLPNAGGTDIQSNRGEVGNGLFPDPPFDAVNSIFNTFGGEPVDQWVDVSAEITSQTNVSLYINHSKILTTYPFVGGNGFYTNGTVMLGYENPLFNQSDNSAYVYYSNVRIVELSPTVTGQAYSAIVTNLNGYSPDVTFTTTGTYASAPLSNAWYSGTTSPTTLLTNSWVAATNLTTSITVTNPQTGGTEYFSVYSDAVGSVTDMMSTIEVIKQSQSIVTAAKGATVTFTYTATGLAAPTTNVWRFNTNGNFTVANVMTNYALNVGNTVPYSGGFTATLTMTNVQPAQAGVYYCAVTNAYGSVLPAYTLSVVTPVMPTFSAVTTVGTNTVIGFSSTDPSENAGSFKLLSSPVVTGPYVTNATAIFSGTNGVFQFVVPKTTNATMFYKLLDIY